MILVVALLQVLDAATTWYALERRGLSEGNPAVKWLMERVGVIPALLIFKVAFVSALYYFKAEDLALYIVSAIYLAIVGNNIYRLYKSTS